MRLHIGGTEPKAGWHNVNAQNLRGVDTVANITDLPLPDCSCDEVYASHVLEHIGYQNELEKALREVYRVLTPGGHFGISVPDLRVLSDLFLSPTLSLAQRFHVMRIMFGGQKDEWDFHKVGLDQEILTHYLFRSGFQAVEKTPPSDVFDDCSRLVLFNATISLNLKATK